jgi:hypothetical protein
VCFGRALLLRFSKRGSNSVFVSADYVVSGDKALLNLKFYHRTEIVSPSRFLKLLFGQA